MPVPLPPKSENISPWFIFKLHSAKISSEFFVYLKYTSLNSSITLSELCLISRLNIDLLKLVVRNFLPSLIVKGYSLKFNSPHSLSGEGRESIKYLSF